MEALFEIVTAVGALLLVNVAVPSGTCGAELQLPPVVHSPPGPSHVPSTARAAPAAKVRKPKLPRSAMRFTTRPSRARDGRNRLTHIITTNTPMGRHAPQRPARKII